MPAPRRAISRPLLISIALAALCAGAVWLARATTAPTHTPVQAPTATEGASVDRASNGRATAADGGEEAAVQAAIRYATASQDWLYLSDEEVHDAVTRIATPASAERLAEEVVTDVALAREGLARSPGRVWWLVRPLATSVDQHSGTHARVQVWVVTVLSAAEVAVPQSEWMTVTVDIERIDGAWLVDDIDSRPGPTPITGPHDQPWDATAFDHALDGFDRLDSNPVQ